MENYERFIRERIQDGWTHKQISDSLKQMNLGERGFSRRSVRRFCLNLGIHYRSRLSSHEVDTMVALAVQSVGHSYGRKTMHGLIASAGIHVSQQRISDSLGRVAPGPLVNRQQNTHRQLNPIPYRANYYGEKLHMDQNEKLVMFGVVHVMAIDGYSRKIVGLITLPNKNATAIYNTLMRPLLLSDGLWEQLRVDHGTEFCLSLAVQQHLCNYRSQQQRPPYLQTTSRQNHRVERMWVEVNQRVNYPVKRILVAMEASGEIDISDNTVKFCVSWTTICVIAPALRAFVQAWNSHRIPGMSGGIPNLLARTSSAIVSLPSQCVPTTTDAVYSFTANGGQLTPEHEFGNDPLRGNPALQNLRQRDFFAQFPDMGSVFENIIHSDGNIFRSCVHHFIDLTNSFTTLL